MGAAIGNIMGIGKGQGDGMMPPTVTKPTAMPTPDDDAMRRARRRSLSEQVARRGRASTILTSDDGLGG